MVDYDRLITRKDAFRLLELAVINFFWDKAKCPVVDPIKKLLFSLIVCVSGLQGEKKPTCLERETEAEHAFLQTYALISALRNTMGGRLPPLSNAQTGRRSFTEWEKIHFSVI